MTNNEIRARLLIEAAGLLEESYGKHGTAEKLAKVRYDNLKSKIDKETAAGRKVDPFHMELTKIGLDREKKFNKDIDTEGANHKDDKSFDSAQLKAKKDDNYDRMLQRTGNFQCLYPWNSVKNYRLHGKINNKAKSQNESVEALLNECYELLEEGAAWREGKPIRTETKAELEKLRKNDQYTKFMKGQLSYDEAEKLYNQVTAELDKFNAKVDAIPDENFGEKVVGTLIMPYKSIKNFLLSEFVPGGIIFSSILKLNDKQYDRHGKLNYTRATIESDIDKIRKSINAAWAKFYKNKKSVVQNESAYDIDIDDLMID